jgi:nitrile hydratase
MGETKLTVVENTDSVQNVIVCTLCSCYPRAVLGLPPDWYRSKSYRARVVIEPRQVLRELGTELPDDITIRVHDSLADLRYLVLPKRPKGTEGWSEEELASIVSRDCMVGVANPKVPA